MAYAAVPEVIRHGVVFDRQANWKNRGYNTAVLIAPITIGGEKYACEVVVKQGSQRQGFYLHEVEITKKLDEAFKTANGSASPVSRLIIAQHFDSARNVSKIVDENGEPKVVYHGSDNQFTVFEPGRSCANMDIQAAFFSPWEDDAKGYGGNIYRCFLISPASARSLGNHGGPDVKYNIIPVIPQMLKNAVLVQTEGHVGRSNDGSKKYNSYSHLLVSKVRYDGQRYIAAMVIHKNNGVNYYDHSTVLISEAKLLDKKEAEAWRGDTPTGVPVLSASAQVLKVVQNALLSSGFDKKADKNASFSFRRHRQRNPIFASEGGFRPDAERANAEKQSVSAEVDHLLSDYGENELRKIHGNLVSILGDKDKAMAAVIRKGAVYFEDGNGSYAVYAEIGDAERKHLEKQTRLDLSSITVHQIDVSGIKHAELEHGPNGKALKKHPEQIPLDLDDYLLIPEIVANSKEISYGGKDSHGNDLIKYRYVKDNEYYYLEEVRSGRGKLTAKTLYKNKKSTPAVPGFSQESSQVSPLTSETFRTRALGDNVTPSSESASDQTKDSFRRHRQVNPILANGANFTAKAEYDRRLEVPYEVKHDAQVKAEAERLIAGFGGIERALKAAARGDFTPSSDAGMCRR